MRYFNVELSSRRAHSGNVPTLGFITGRPLLRHVRAVASAHWESRWTLALIVLCDVLFADQFLAIFVLCQEPFLNIFSIECMTTVVLLGKFNR